MYLSAKGDIRFNTFNNKVLLRAYLNIESGGIDSITEIDTFSAVRLCLFERSLIWAKELFTDELILEDEAKSYLMYKSNLFLDSSLNDKMNQFLFSRDIPNLSLLYYNKIIDIDKIVQVRDSIDGIKFRNWIRSNEYDPNKLEKVLLGSKSTPQAEKWCRWGIATAVGAFLPGVGLILSGLNEIIPSFNQQIPDIYFDRVLSRIFNNRKNRKALTMIK